MSNDYKGLVDVKLNEDGTLDEEFMSESALKTLYIEMARADKGSERISAAKGILDYTRPKKKAIDFGSQQAVTINFISAIDKAQLVRLKELELQNVQLSLPPGLRTTRQEPQIVVEATFVGES